MGLREDLVAVVGEVAAVFQEREREARLITVGLLAGQHTLLLGPPGTAKSAIVRELTGRITGGRYWELLLSRYTAPTEIFGPIDVGALARGEYRQLLDGHATTADVAFLDEVFKCGPAALNSMLSYLNERLYHPASGGDPIRCPLLGAVCASNELAEDETTAALWDRILIRLEVDYLAGAEAFEALLASAVTAPGQEREPVRRTTVELGALRQAVTGEVPAVAMGGTVRGALRDLRSDLRSREITASDRRWKQLVRVLQAGAWLAGREHIVVDDLAVCEHVLWDSPAQRGTVARVLRGYLTPDDQALADVADQIDRAENELDKLLRGDAEALRDWALEHNSTLNTARRQLVRLRTDAETAGRDTSWHTATLEHATRVQTTLLTEALGMSPETVAARLAGGVR